jgi:tetratricopeptide (TPR) repeat protein
MSDGAFSDRLTQLRNRWESDPSSRIFLQLAEEYRHQGRVKEALNVLEKGLKEHPGYLSALVAKGRCLVELGEPEEARGVLERVVKQDATQMVANKLLVRAYLDTGEPERARERLDLYSLLNDSDPDIEELRRRIRSMEQAPQADKPDPTQSAAPFPNLAPPPLAGGGDVFDLGGAPGPRREVQDVFELEAPPPTAAPPVAATAPGDVFDLPAPAAPLAFQAGEGDVFADLFAPVSGDRHLSALAAEGLFFFETPAAPEPAAPAPPPVESAPAAPEPFAWAFERAASAPVEAPPLPAEPVFLPEEEPAPVVEPVLEDVETRHVASVLEDTTPWAAEPAPPAAEPELEPVATVTLGEIYLRQGHREEAERIFLEVLRREPDSAAAHEALARLAPPPPPPAPEPVAVPQPLDAGQIVAGFGEAPAGPLGANARKAFVLRKYLERIRQGSERHVS